MKQKMFIILFGVIALVLGVVFSIRGWSDGIARPTPTPTPREALSPPKIIVIPDAPTAVSFSSIKIPPTDSVLPVFSYSKKNFTVDEAAAVAKRFGFSDIPLKTLSKSTTTFQWTNKSASLTLFQQGGWSRWKFNQNESVFIHEPVSGAAEAKNFIETIFPPSPNSCSLVLTKESVGQFDGVVSAEKLQGFYFSCQTPNNQNIVGPSFGNIAVSLIVNQSGVIRSLTYGFIVDISPAHEELILSPDEAVYNLKSGKGVLVSIGKSSSFSFFDEVPSFQDVLFSSFSFIYFPNDESLLLEPYYLFTGTTNSGGRDIVVEYAVSALIKNN